MGNVKSILMSPDQTRVTVPIGYEVPSFPSLYAPNADGARQVLLYYAEDMWRFTVLWTMILVGSIHLASGLLAAAVFCRKHPLLACAIPFVAAAVGSIFSFLAGSIVGVALAAIYNASHFSMSTWVPFLWGASIAMTYVIGSYNNVSAII